MVLCKFCISLFFYFISSSLLFSVFSSLAFPPFRFLFPTHVLHPSSSGSKCLHSSSSFALSRFLATRLTPHLSALFPPCRRRRRAQGKKRRLRAMCRCQESGQGEGQRPGWVEQRGWCRDKSGQRRWLARWQGRRRACGREGHRDRGRGKGQEGPLLATDPAKTRPGMTVRFSEGGTRRGRWAGRGGGRRKGGGLKTKPKSAERMVNEFLSRS